MNYYNIIFSLTIEYGELGEMKEVDINKEINKLLVPIAKERNEILKQLIAEHGEIEIKDQIIETEHDIQQGLDAVSITTICRFPKVDKELIKFLKDEFDEYEEI